MKLRIDPRKKAATIPIKVLRQHVGYDPKTGNLWWKKAAKGRTLGVPFGANSTTRYIQFGFQRRVFFAHRVAFAIHHGRWVAEVDHRNGNGRDNRAENLREVDRSQNNANQAKGRSNNTSGIKGVHFVTRLQKWCALVTFRGHKVCKHFDDIGEAEKFRKKMEKQVFGEFRHVG